MPLGTVLRRRFLGLLQKLVRRQGIMGIDDGGKSRLEVRQDCVSLGTELEAGTLVGQALDEEVSRGFALTVTLQRMIRVHSLTVWEKLRAPRAVPRALLPPERADTDPHQTAAGVKWERQLGKIIQILQEQTWQLVLIADVLTAEERI